MIQANSSNTILVVEDAYLVGLQLKDDLESLGYTVIGPASSVRKAIDLINGNAVCGAVLDVNLGHENSIPIANRLDEDNVPFIFITGYESVSADDTIFTNKKLLRKPILIDEVKIALGDL
jgi:DNA-binding response OmpR family regulator